jgi:hypothetical protein
LGFGVWCFHLWLLPVTFSLSRPALMSIYGTDASIYGCFLPGNRPYIYSLKSRFKGFRGPFTSVITCQIIAHLPPRTGERSAHQPLSPNKPENPTALIVYLLGICPSGPGSERGTHPLGQPWSWCHRYRGSEPVLSVENVRAGTRGLRKKKGVICKK